MRLMVAGPVALLVAGLSASPALAQPTAPACVQPKLETMLPGGPGYVYPELRSKTLVLGTGVERVQWVVASWFGPMFGRVFVLDCAGKVLAEAELGYLRLMEPGPVLPGVGRTLQVEATTGTGTGYLENTAFVLGLMDGRVVRLWEHLSLKRDSGQPASAFEDTWRGKIASGGLRIDVTGARMIPAHGGRKAAKAALPAEAFCWDGAGYAPCK